MTILTAKLGTSQLNLIADIISSLDSKKRYTKKQLAAVFTTEFVCRNVNPKFKREYFNDAATHGVKKRRPSRNDR